MQAEKRHPSKPALLQILQCSSSAKSHAKKEAAYNRKITYEMHYISGNCFPEILILGKFAYNMCILGEICMEKLVNFRENLFLKITN